MTDAVIDLKFLVDDSDLDKAVRKTKNFENRIKRLAQAESQGKITKDQYTNSVKQMASELQRLSGGTITARNSIFKYSQSVYKASKNVEENTKDVTQNTVAINNQNKAFVRTTKAINQYGDRTGLSGKRTNRLGMQLQQAGYQVGDFFVQIQSGTNAMVAFGQQATQLLGVFGTAGALAGAGLAITTALIAPLMRGEREAAKLVDRIKELRTEVNDLQGNQVMPDEAIAAFRLLEDIDARRLGLNERLAKAQEVAMQLADRGGIAQQNALSQVYEIERQLAALEEERQGIAEQTLEYQDLLAQKKKALANQESTNMNREIALLQTQIEFGEESLELQELITKQTLAAYEEDLKRLHLSPQVIESLMAQKQIALELANELARAANNTESIAALQFEFSAGGQALSRYGARGERTSAQISLERRNTPKKTSRGGGTKSESERIQETLQKLKDQLKLERELVGVSDERARIIKALGIDYVNANPKIVAGLEEQIQKTQELIELEEKRQRIVDTVESSMENALMSMVDGTKTVKEAFRDMARDIISELYRVLVVQQMVNAISGALFGGSGSDGGFLGGLFGSSGGGGGASFDGGGYTGNGPRSGGLDGKGGFLAMMHPQETVVDHTKGQTMGEAVVVNQTFNFSANGDESVKKIIAKEAPKIASMAKEEVIRARRKGGAMKAAFG